MNRTEEITTNLAEVRRRLEKAALASGREPNEVKLIAVTKNFPVSDAQILYNLGIRDFGENREEEGALKAEKLPADIVWHFQGQIQSRKIKSILSWADEVHSLDSLEHARKINSIVQSSLEGEFKEKFFFVQINLEPDREDRGGVAPADVESFMHTLFSETQISPIGLMTVAPQEAAAENAFSEIRRIRDQLLGQYPSLAYLSMGMSGDFETAIACGATHIRLGSSILGSRGLFA